MFRIGHVIAGGALLVFASLSGSAIAAPAGLGAANSDVPSSVTLAGGHGGHGGGHWGGHGGHWGGGRGFYGRGFGYGYGRRHFRGGYYFYGGGYPYWDDYYYDDYAEPYYGNCYYSRRYRARICPDY
jgi:hypothetical protein